MRTTRLPSPSSLFAGSGLTISFLALRRRNALCVASIPVSSTAHRIPVVFAANNRAAASAFTVSRERQTLVLARRLRLMLHRTPAALDGMSGRFS